MQAYRLSTKFKLGLIVFALLIAIASLFYTNKLANQLQEREKNALAQWVRAYEIVSMNQSNPHVDAFMLLKERINASDSFSITLKDSLSEAINWAEQMPPTEMMDFLFNDLVRSFKERSSIPIIRTDSTLQQFLDVIHIGVDSSLSQEQQQAFLRKEVEKMDAINAPLRVEIIYPGFPPLVQLVHFGEPTLVQQLRYFPYVQLLFVALFIIVGYLGFSYLRRSEQSNLWVGMAKEAAHQLGTPTSSMMGWVTLMKELEWESKDELNIIGELEKDIERLHRVANRFSKIGSKPQLHKQPLNPVIEQVVDYIQRRAPQQINIELSLEPNLQASLEPELFEWVIENLLKNALDAMPPEGTIKIKGSQKEQTIDIFVSDSGKGMERSVAKNIFKPGFSTKKRGWGLGLSLSKRIIEAYHNGALSLSATKPSEGTTFLIQLPV